MSVRNDTSVVIVGVQAQFQYVGSDGNQRRRTQGFGGQIAPGKIASVRTGLIPYVGTRCTASVIAAEIVP